MLSAYEYFHKHFTDYEEAIAFFEDPSIEQVLKPNISEENMKMLLG